MTSKLRMCGAILFAAATLSILSPVAASAQASVSAKSATIANQLTTWSTVPVNAASAGSIPDLTVSQFNPAL